MNLKCEQNLVKKQKQLIPDFKQDQDLNTNDFLQLSDINNRVNTIIEEQNIESCNNPIASPLNPCSNEFSTRQHQQTDPMFKPLSLNKNSLIQQSQQPRKRQKPLQQKQHRRTLKMEKSRLIQIQKHLLQKIIKQNDTLKLTIQQLKKMSQKMKRSEQIFNQSKQKMKLKYQRVNLQLKRSRQIQKEKIRQISQMRFENEKLRIEVAALERYRQFNIESGKQVVEQSLLLQQSCERVQKSKCGNNIAIDNNVIQFIYQPQLFPLIHLPKYVHLFQQQPFYSSNSFRSPFIKTSANEQSPIKVGNEQSPIKAINVQSLIKVGNQSIVSLQHMTDSNKYSRVSLMYSDIRNSQSKQQQNNHYLTQTIQQKQTQTITLHNQLSSGFKNQYIEQLQQQQQVYNFQNSSKLFEKVEYCNNRKPLINEIQQFKVNEFEEQPSCQVQELLLQEQLNQQNLSIDFSKLQYPVVNNNTTSEHSNKSQIEEDIPQILTELKSQISQSLNCMGRISQSLHQKLSNTHNLQKIYIHIHSNTNLMQIKTQLQDGRNQEIKELSDRMNRVQKHMNTDIENNSQENLSYKPTIDNTVEKTMIIIISNLLTETSITSALLEIVVQQLEEEENNQQQQLIFANKQLRVENMNLRKDRDNLQQVNEQIGRQIVLLLEDKQRNTDAFSVEQGNIVQRDHLEQELSMMKGQLQQLLLGEEQQQQGQQGQQRQQEHQEQKQYAVVESIPSADDWVNSTPSQVKQSNQLPQSPQQQIQSNNSLSQNNIIHQLDDQYQQLITQLQSQLKSIKHQLTHQSHSAQSNLNTLLNSISSICILISQYVQNYQQLSNSELQMQEHYISVKAQSVIDQENNNNRWVDGDVQCGQIQAAVAKKALSTKQEITQLKKQIIQKQLLINQYKHYIIKILNHHLNTIHIATNKQQNNNHSSSEFCPINIRDSNHIPATIISELKQLIEQKQKYTRQLEDKLQHSAVNSQRSQPYITLFSIHQQQLSQQEPQLIIQESICSSNSNLNSQQQDQIHK